MNQDDSWAQYARIQAQAQSPHLSDRAQAADEALDTILDLIELGQAVSAKQADNLLINRARTLRERRSLLARHTPLLYDPVANDEDGRLEARSELARHRDRCSGREWRVLVSTGLGHTYSSIAGTEDVPEATIKTWVRRARLKLAVNAVAGGQ